MATESILSKIERRSKAETLYWAGVLIWAGLIFGVDSMGLLPQVGSADAWSWVFIGVGLYGTCMNLYSSTLPDTITTTWDYTWSGFWLLIGLSGLIGFDVFWPLVLVLIGLAVLVMAYRSR